MFFWSKEVIFLAPSRTFAILYSMWVGRNLVPMACHSKTARFNFVVVVVEGETVRGQIIAKNVKPTEIWCQFLFNTSFYFSATKICSSFVGIFNLFSSVMVTVLSIICRPISVKMTENQTTLSSFDGPNNSNEIWGNEEDNVLYHAIFSYSWFFSVWM